MITTRSQANPWLLLVILGAVLVAAVPYIFGHAIAPTGYEFQGNTILSPGDPNVYYSYIEQARQGSILMRDVFTSEAQTATLWQPVWLSIGWLANLVHLSTPVAYAMARIGSVLVFLLTLWWTVKKMWPDALHRRLGLLTVMGASGLGGIFIVLTGQTTQSFPQLPPDVWVAEMVPLLSSWTTPHFLLVTSGLLYVLISVEVLWDKRSWRHWWLVGLAAALTISVHPFHLLTWTLLWAGLTLWRWVTTRRFPGGYVCRWGTVIFMSLPVVVYYILGLVSDPIVQARAAQNINLTPAWWLVVLSLGLLLPLAASGAYRKKIPTVWAQWLTAWAVIGIIVIFLPFSSQRRLMQGLSIPFALLSTITLAAWWQRLSVVRTKRVVLFAVLSIVLTSSSVWAGRWIIQEYLHERNGLPHRAYFLSPEYQSLTAYIRQTIPVDQPILSTLLNGNSIGGLTGKTVVIGHPVETVRYQEKLVAMQSFYGQATPAEQAKMLAKYRVCYVLDGPRERAYGAAWQPENWPNVRLAWSGLTTKLYRLTDCQTTE